jgi:uncharacterized protein
VPIRDTLQQQLADALRARDRGVTDAARSALAALANAEAAPVPEAPAAAPLSEHVAGATAGLAATEAPRVPLTEEAARALVATERDGLLHHAERLARLCRHDEADAARRGAGALSDALAAAR